MSTSKPAPSDKKTERPPTDYTKLETVNLSFNRPAKWYMYIVKQDLQHRDTVDIRARPLGAAQVVRVAEALKRLGYITYQKYYTTTLSKKENSKDTLSSPSKRPATSKNYTTKEKPKEKN